MTMTNNPDRAEVERLEQLAWDATGEATELAVQIVTLRVKLA